MTTTELTEVSAMYARLLGNNNCEFDYLNKIASELAEPFETQKFPELEAFFSLERNKKELGQVFKMQDKLVFFVITFIRN